MMICPDRKPQSIPPIPAAQCRSLNSQRQMDDLERCKRVKTMLIQFQSQSKFPDLNDGLTNSRVKDPYRASQCSCEVKNDRTSNSDRSTLSTSKLLKGVW